MAWTPVGVTVSVTVTTGLQFIGAAPNTITGSQIAALISRVFCGAAAVQSFTLGPSTGSNSRAIKMAPNQVMYIAHGPTENFFWASAAGFEICPGVGNITT